MRPRSRSRCSRCWPSRGGAEPARTPPGPDPAPPGGAVLNDVRRDERFDDAGRPMLIAASSSLLLCLFLSPKFIEFLRNRSFGQEIRKELIQHAGKQGTPTMGGIIVVVAFGIPYLILSSRDARSLGVFAAVVACALLGFGDDYLKIRLRRSLGLRARAKLGGTILISVMLWFIATHWGHVSTAISLRPFHGHVDLGPFFVIFI